jgi:protein ImuB
VRVPWFVAAAVERCEPALRERPLAVLAGTPPTARVVEANAAARAHGVRPGLTEAEAGARCRALVRRAVSDEVVASARHALLEACLAVSPRVEDTDGGVVVVDVAGLERLIGPAAAVAQALRRRAHGVGLPARVGVAGTRAAARVAAGLADPVAIVAPGEEPGALARVPLAALAVPEDVAAAFARWGVTTLGEVGRLPRAGLASRLGPAGLAVHDLALGIDRTPFRAWAPAPFWEEAQGLDWEIDTLGALAVPLRAVLERLAARLEASQRWADALTLRLALAPGGHHPRTVPLAAPMGEAGPMLTLLLLDLEAHPPPAPVTGVAVSARAVPRRALPGGLWHRSPPALRDLAAVLARLASLVGAANVGAPVVLDSHRPDAVTLAPFAVTAPDAVARPEPEDRAGPGGEPTAPGDERRLGLRRARPSRRVDVEADGDARPAWVTRDGRRRRVVACAGPWRLSGDWWDVHAWARDEWDVALDDGLLCRLARDRVSGAWLLDGVYD